MQLTGAAAAGRLGVIEGIPLSFVVLAIHDESKPRFVAVPA